MKRARLPIWLLLGLAPLSAGGQESVSAPPDYEIAREAVERGEIRPLAEVLAAVREAHPGRVIDVELEYGMMSRIYEVEILTDGGRLIEVEVEAATGAILGIDEDDD